MPPWTLSVLVLVASPTAASSETPSPSSEDAAVQGDATANRGDRARADGAEETRWESPLRLSQDAYNAISELARVAFPVRLDFGRPRPGRSDGYGLRLRPTLVMPVPLPKEWKIVPRVRMPVWLALQDDSDDVHAGLSDIETTVWLATPEWGFIEVGLGPFVGWPTAGSSAVGDGEWAVGPSAAIVATPGPFVAHVLATHRFTVESGEQDTEIESSVRWNSERGWSVGVTSESEIATANPLDADVHLGPTLGRVISTRVVHMQLELAVVGWVARDGQTPSAAVELTTAFLLPDASPARRRVDGRRR